MEALERAILDPVLWRSFSWLDAQGGLFGRLHRFCMACGLAWAGQIPRGQEVQIGCPSCNPTHRLTPLMSNVRFDAIDATTITPSVFPEKAVNLEPYL